MSEIMYPSPFRDLMRWVVTERNNCGEVFGIYQSYHADPTTTLPIFPDARPCFSASASGTATFT